jgi:hypothetical protein
MAQGFVEVVHRLGMRTSPSEEASSFQAREEIAVVETPRQVRGLVIHKLAYFPAIVFAFVAFNEFIFDSNMTAGDIGGMLFLLFAAGVILVNEFFTISTELLFQIK